MEYLASNGSLFIPTAYYSVATNSNVAHFESVTAVWKFIRHPNDLMRHLHNWAIAWSYNWLNSFADIKKGKKSTGIRDGVM